MTGIVLNFASLPKEAKARSDEAFEREHYINSLKELQSEIDRLAPNLRSLDKYEAHFILTSFLDWRQQKLDFVPPWMPLKKLAKRQRP